MVSSRQITPVRASPAAQVGRPADIHHAACEVAEPVDPWQPRKHRTGVPSSVQARASPAGRLKGHHHEYAGTRRARQSIGPSSSARRTVAQVRPVRQSANGGRSGATGGAIGIGSIAGGAAGYPGDDPPARSWFTTPGDAVDDPVSHTSAPVDPPGYGLFDRVGGKSREVDVVLQTVEIERSGPTRIDLLRPGRAVAVSVASAWLRPGRVTAPGSRSFLRGLHSKVLVQGSARRPRDHRTAGWKVPVGMMRRPHEPPEWW